MVRFSDMLGADGEPEDARATTAADLAPPDDESPDAHLVPADDVTDATPEDAPPGPEATAPSPQEVLDRLTRYASRTREAEPAARPAEPEAEASPAPPAPEAPAPEPPAPAEEPGRQPRNDDAGDDILPRAKRTLRNPRGTRKD
jgi:hypothetical protein